MLSGEARGGVGEDRPGRKSGGVAKWGNKGKKWGDNGQNWVDTDQTDIIIPIADHILREV